MHKLTRMLAQTLAEQNIIPPAVILAKLSIIADPHARQINLPKTAITARSQSIHYQFSVVIHFEGLPYVCQLVFLEQTEPLKAKMSFSPNTQGHTFSEAAISKFTLMIDDQNPLHKGDYPLVPGLMMLDWFLQQQPSMPSAFTMRFKTPLFANQAFALTHYEKGMALIQDQTLIAQIVIQGQETTDFEETDY